MPLRIRFPAAPDQSYAFAVEQLSTGLYFDFTATALSFTAKPAQYTSPLPADPIFPGRYGTTIAATPVATWPDGEYAIVVVPGAAIFTPGVTPIAGQLTAEMHYGDDTPPNWAMRIGQALAAALSSATT